MEISKASRSVAVVTGEEAAEVFECSSKNRDWQMIEDGSPYES